MSELTESFESVDLAKPADRELWEAADKAALLFKNHFWRGRVLHGTNGNPITDVGQLTACIQAGTWPGKVEANGADDARKEVIRENTWIVRLG